MGARSRLFWGAVAVGAAAGWVLSQRRQRAHRTNLFSPQPLRRQAALGFLAGQEDVTTVRLLRDYLAWEREPMLRRRAEAIMRRMRAALAAGGPA